MSDQTEPNNYKEEPLPRIPDGPIEPADWVDAVSLAVGRVAPPASNVGRPSKFTVSHVAALLAAVTLGHTLKSATQLAQIGYDTFLSWRERGQAGEPGFSEFIELLDLANSMGQDWHIRNIRRHSHTDWKASMTHLERRWRVDWAKSETLHLNPGDGNEPSKGTLPILTTSESAMAQLGGMLQALMTLAPPGPTTVKVETLDITPRPKPDTLPEPGTAPAE